MSDSNTFIDMVSDENWLNSFYNKLKNHLPIIIYEYQIELINTQNNGVNTFKLQIFDKANMKVSDSYIDLFKAPAGKMLNFIEVDHSYYNRHPHFIMIYLLLIIFMYRCYQQRNLTDNILDKLISKVTNKIIYKNNHPMFTYDNLQSFFNTEIKNTLENFISQATRLNDSTELYSQNKIINCIINDSSYQKYKVNLTILQLVSAFINFCNESDETGNSSLNNQNQNQTSQKSWKQAKKQPSNMTKDYVKKLLIFRDEHANLSPTDNINRFTTKIGEGSKSTILRWFGSSDIKQFIENFYHEVTLSPTQAFKKLNLEELDDLFDSFPKQTKYSK
jgi:hypothetical protein